MKEKELEDWKKIKDLEELAREIFRERSPYYNGMLSEELLRVLSSLREAVWQVCGKYNLIFSKINYPDETTILCLIKESGKI